MVIIVCGKTLYIPCPVSEFDLSVCSHDTWHFSILLKKALTVKWTASMLRFKTRTFIQLVFNK